MVNIEKYNLKYVIKGGPHSASNCGDNYNSSSGSKELMIIQNTQ